MWKAIRKYCWHCDEQKCWKYWLLLLGKITLAIIAFIILPTTFITSWYIPLGILNTNFTNTGQIGDTIGGITAPIVGLISIWLLYITFREQRNFNKKQLEFQQKQHEFNRTQATFESEQYNFNNAQIEFQKQQQEFNKRQVELNQKQLRVDNYNLYVNINNLLFEKIDSILVTYTNHQQSIGYDTFIVLNKLHPISVKEFGKLFNQLKNLQHLIEKFLQINRKSDVAYANRKVFYENTLEYIKKIRSYYEYLQSEKLNIEQFENKDFEGQQINILKNEIPNQITKLDHIEKEYLPKPRKKSSNTQSTNK